MMQIDQTMVQVRLIYVAILAAVVEIWGLIEIAVKWLAWFMPCARSV